MILRDKTSLSTDPRITFTDDTALALAADDEVRLHVNLNPPTRSTRTKQLLW